MVAGVAVDENGSLFGQAILRARTSRPVQYRRICCRRAVLCGWTHVRTTRSIQRNLFAANEVSETFAIVSTAVWKAFRTLRSQLAGTIDRREA